MNILKKIKGISIIIALAILSFGIIGNTSVSAASVQMQSMPGSRIDFNQFSSLGFRPRLSPMITNEYYKFINPSGPWIQAFCIEPATSLNSGDVGSVANFSTGYSFTPDGTNTPWFVDSQQVSSIGRVLYFARVVAENHGLPYYEMGTPKNNESHGWSHATQAIVWEIVLGERDASSLSRQGRDIIRPAMSGNTGWDARYQYYYSAINNLLENYLVNPSFSKSVTVGGPAPKHSLTLGQPLTLADSTGSLASGKYGRIELVDLRNNTPLPHSSASRSGSNLTINISQTSAALESAISAGTVGVMGYLRTLAPGTPDIQYFSMVGNKQSVMSGSIKDPQAFLLSIEIALAGDIEVNKYSLDKYFDALPNWMGSRVISNGNVLLDDNNNPVNFPTKREVIDNDLWGDTVSFTIGGSTITPTYDDGTGTMVPYVIPAKPSVALDPLADVRLRVQSNAVPSSTWEITTDANGRAELLDVPGGTYTVTELSNPYNSHGLVSGTVVVNPDSTSTLNLYDMPYPVVVDITKESNRGAKLPGAIFEVTMNSGTDNLINVNNDEVAYYDMIRRNDGNVLASYNMAIKKDMMEGSVSNYLKVYSTNPSGVFVPYSVEYYDSMNNLLTEEPTAVGNYSVRIFTATQNMAISLQIRNTALPQTNEIRMLTDHTGHAVFSKETLTAYDLQNVTSINVKEVAPPPGYRLIEGDIDFSVAYAAGNFTINTVSEWADDLGIVMTLTQDAGGTYRFSLVVPNIEIGDLTIVKSSLDKYFEHLPEWLGTPVIVDGETLLDDDGNVLKFPTKREVIDNNLWGKIMSFTVGGEIITPTYVDSEDDELAYLTPLKPDVELDVLSNVKLHIQSQDDPTKEWELVTDTDGKIFLSGIDTGRYTVTELSNPYNGHSLITSTVDVVVGVNTTLNLYNMPYPVSFEINKDDGNGNPLENAYFEISIFSATEDMFSKNDKDTMYYKMIKSVSESGTIASYDMAIKENAKDVSMDNYLKVYSVDEEGNDIPYEIEYLDSDRNVMENEPYDIGDYFATISNESGEITVKIKISNSDLTKTNEIMMITNSDGSVVFSNEDFTAFDLSKIERVRIEEIYAPLGYHALIDEVLFRATYADEAFTFDVTSPWAIGLGLTLALTQDTDGTYKFVATVPNREAGEPYATKFIKDGEVIGAEIELVDYMKPFQFGINYFFNDSATKYDQIVFKDTISDKLDIISVKAVDDKGSEIPLEHLNPNYMTDNKIEAKIDVDDFTPYQNKRITMYVEVKYKDSARTEILKTIKIEDIEDKEKEINFLPIYSKPTSIIDDGVFTYKEIQNKEDKTSMKISIENTSGSSISPSDYRYALINPKGEIVAKSADTPLSKLRIVAGETMETEIMLSKLTEGKYTLEIYGPAGEDNISFTLSELNIFSLYPELGSENKNKDGLVCNPISNTFKETTYPEVRNAATFEIIDRNIKIGDVYANLGTNEVIVIEHVDVERAEEFECLAPKLGVDAPNIVDIIINIPKMLIELFK